MFEKEGIVGEEIIVHDSGEDDGAGVRDLALDERVAGLRRSDVESALLVDDAGSECTVGGKDGELGTSTKLLRTSSLMHELKIL